MSTYAPFKPLPITVPQAVADENARQIAAEFVAELKTLYDWVKDNVPMLKGMDEEGRFAHYYAMTDAFDLSLLLLDDYPSMLEQGLAPQMHHPRWQIIASMPDLWADSRSDFVSGLKRRGLVAAQ